MKTLFISLILLSTSLWSGSLSSTEITNMISKIKEEREGISIAQLEQTLNPFILNKKKKVEVIKDEPVLIEAIPVEPEYLLQAVLNHAAFINSKWYKVGDTLGLYRVGYIGSSQVTLKSAHGNKTLFIKKKKKKMFIKLNQGKR